MAFVVRPNMTFETRVTIKQPDPHKTGNFLSETFIAVFKALPIADIDEHDQRVADLARRIEDGEAGTMSGIEELVREVMVGWKDVKAESGEALEFTPDNLDVALSLPWFRLPVFLAYKAALQGKPVRGAHRGN